MKVGRQNKIIELIARHNVETQEELAELLNQAGYQVTQATISRDIRELKLTKVQAENGRQKYVALKKDADLGEKYVRVLKEGFVSMDLAQNLVVVKTVSGMAMAVAAAIDAMHLHGVVGCIAGDDTIMCAVRTDQEAEKVMESLQRLIRG